MHRIDIDFDYRIDSKCGDPDTDSLKLYEAHKKLWKKTILKGITFELEISGNKYGRLVLENDYCGNMSSDRMCPHFVDKYGGRFNSWLAETERDEFKRKVRTIGGHIIFPAHRTNGFTINQSRGVNRKICDRFDLTLECIRRFYNKEESPLHETLLRYSNFFDLFSDFSSYIDFFLLQDFINENQQVRFSLPFDGFNRSPLPQTKDEYKEYKDHTIVLINSRNKRILENLNNAS